MNTEWQLSNLGNILKELSEGLEDLNRTLGGIEDSLDAIVDKAEDINLTLEAMNERIGHDK